MALDATTDPILAGEVGMLPGTDAVGIFSKRWDPRDNFKDKTDLGWIGEDEKGIWMARHPESVILDYPRLWDTVTDWRYGMHEIERRDIETLSAFEMRAKITMAAAAQRKMSRKIDGKDG